MYMIAGAVLRVTGPALANLWRAALVNESSTMYYLSELRRVDSIT